MATCVNAKLARACAYCSLNSERPPLLCFFALSLHISSHACGNLAVVWLRPPISWIPAPIPASRARAYLSLSKSPASCACVLLRNFVVVTTGFDWFLRYLPAVGPMPALNAEARTLFESSSYRNTARTRAHSPVPRFESCLYQFGLRRASSVGTAGLRLAGP